jgi:2-keto-myo-inositol isomerase
MKPCLSQTLILPQDFAADVAAFAEAGWEAMEVWLTKLEEHRRRFSADQTRELLERHRLRAVAATAQGGLLLSWGEQRREHLDQFQRRLALCQELGIPTMVVLADVSDQAEPGFMTRACQSLQQIGELAAAYEVRLALEFHAKARWCACLETAVALVQACRLPNVGVCLDLFHYYTGPSKPEDLLLLTSANLFHVQVCDLAGVPRELAGDSHRILPGDGEFRLEPVIERLHDIGYQGWVSVELFHPQFWPIHAVQVAAAARQAVLRILERPARQAAES